MSPIAGQRGGRDGDRTLHLVRGDDPALVAQAAKALVDRLVGDLDPSLVVEEHSGAEELDVGAVVDACTTPPFLVARRVVVVRDAGRLSSGDGARLSEALERRLPDVHLVLVAGAGHVPQVLVKAAQGAGEVLDAGAGRGKERARWLAEQVRHGPVGLDASALRRLDEHLGEDVGRLAGILAALAAAYGDVGTVGVDEIEPFLGEAGAVPPWELTDAIDAGDVPGALRALRRMTGPGARAAPAIVAILHSHYSNMLRLDGADAATGEAAAVLLGVRSAFVAKKALDGARRLGSERIGQAVGWIADADLDVKGRTGLAPDVVLDVLVARLARLSRTRPAPMGRGRPARGRPSTRR